MGQAMTSEPPHPVVRRLCLDEFLAILLLCIIYLGFLATGPTFARDRANSRNSSLPTLATDRHVLYGGSPYHVKAPVDSIHVYGGPGSLEGTFEDAYGQPDWQGWYGVDLSLGPNDSWHVDTYNCADLDPSETPNHA